MLNRSKLYAATLLAGAFLAGAAVGGAAQAAWGDRDRRESHDGRRGEAGYVDRLTHELGLTASQRDSVARIIEESSGAMEMLWTEIRPRMDSLRTGIRDRIGATLSPDQRERFGALNARSDSVRASRARGRTHAR